MRNMINQIKLILIAFLFFACNQNEIIKVQSPDGKIQINFGINDSSAIYYSVDVEDSVIIRNSKMGFQFDGEEKEIKFFPMVALFSDLQVYNPENNK